MLSLNPTLRRSIRPLALAAFVTLVGCSPDVTGPAAESAPSTTLARSASGALELPVPGDTLPVRPTVSPKRTGLRIVNQPGLEAPTWAHFRADGRFLRSFASYDAAVEAMQQVPASRGRHIGVAIDYTSRAQSAAVLDVILERHEERLLQFEIQILLADYEADPSSLSDFDRRYVESFLIPWINVHEDLAAVRAAIGDGPVLQRGVWKILQAFVETLTSSEDHRMEDHDGDGTPNSRDNDYSGTVWKNGPITVTGGGDTTTITVGGCVDPCTMFPGGC